MTNAKPVVAPAIPWQTAKIERVVQSTPRIKTFVLTPSMPMAFIPGQHVDVRLTAPDGYRAMRSYSIASTPGDGRTFELAIELLDDGEVSAFFHTVVVPGDVIELRGPLGGFFQWPADSIEPVLLIGGGSGIVPLLSMARYRAATNDMRPTAMLYSARNIDDILEREDLLALDARDDGFSLIFTLTRGMRMRAGDFTRRVDASMLEALLRRLPAPPGPVFICGTNGFVSAATDAALASNIRRADIRTERYGA